MGGNGARGEVRVTYYRTPTNPYPVDRSWNRDDSEFVGTSHVITMPDTTIVSGDLLVLYVTFDNNAGTINTPSGWTAKGQAGQTGVRAACFSKTASGGDTVTVTTSTGGPCSHWVYMLRGWGSIDVTVTSGTSGQANPPNVSPAGGQDDYLFLAACGLSSADGGQQVIAPGGYSQLISVPPNKEAGGGTGAYVAQRRLNAINHDPGLFSHTNTNWVAHTIAIAPA